MFELVTSRPEDLHNISVCHKSCFKDSLSTKLGMQYIKKSFEWFLQKNNCFLFHIVKQNVVVGYCGGFIPLYVGDGSTSGIMQYTMNEAILGIILHPWLLLHKEVTDIYPLILKNIRKKFLKKKIMNTIPVAAFDKRVGLVVIGVHPEHRGSGIFQLLMQEFEIKAKDNQINKLVLSVKKNNTRAIKAYTNQGWFIAIEHNYTLEMCKYI